jgi:F-type H+-transporting ATPase subunit epsilon
MKLEVSTPTAIAVREEDLRSVRADDASGSFGIWRGHANLITVLSVSVLSWCRADGTQSYCAVRGGVLTVLGGDRVAVATEEAVPGDDLARLERDERLLRYARPGTAVAGPGRLTPGPEERDGHA